MPSLLSLKRILKAFNSMTLTNLHVNLPLGIIEQSAGDSKKRESAADRVRIVCDLFNLAFEMKSLELERRFPQAATEWIKFETLRLIELGSK